MVRLDAIMEENRQMAVKRAETEEDRRHGLRLQNLAALKEQIHALETAKVLATTFALVPRNASCSFWVEV